MAKRKINQVLDDEGVLRKPVKQVRKQKNSSKKATYKNISLKEKHDSTMDNNTDNLPGPSGTGRNISCATLPHEGVLQKRKNSSKKSNENMSLNEKHDSTMDNNTGYLPGPSGSVSDSCEQSFSKFTSHLDAGLQEGSSQNASYEGEEGSSQNASYEGEEGSSQNPSYEEENSINYNERIFNMEVNSPSLPSWETTLESDERVIVLPVPAKLSEIVLLEHPSSVTLHGYVKVSVLLGRVSILGYLVKEGEHVEVFSTEGSGLKKVSTLRSVHMSKHETVEREVKKVAFYGNVDVEKFLDNIGANTVVIIVKKILTPIPLRFLAQYYPHALQTRWPRNAKLRKRKFELCSTEESYVINISSDFKILSEEINEIITNEVNPIINEPVSDDEKDGPRIIVLGEKDLGKSTLIRYLMNSTLNKHPVLYFLDTDLGQTEYTPPGVVSLFRVTKPLLGPPFAHQKKALKMIYVGSVSPATSPELYKRSIVSLMKYFNKNFRKETLFVNTMGWCQGVGELCLQNIRDPVKPTVVIHLKTPDPQFSIRKEVAESIHYFEIPSMAPTRESDAPSYNPKELRNFSIMAYFGQCQKSYLPVNLINAIHPVCVSWDDVALYVMGKKVPPQRLTEAINCSIVALCRVNLSYVLASDKPKQFPKTLCDEPLCVCLGFGLVRASDIENRLYYIVTPLEIDQLKNVNALVKGNITIPDEVFLKQNIPNIPLPFTDHSVICKTPGLKPVLKRAFRNTLTPNKKM